MRRLIDILFLTLLCAYVLAGTPNTPFHGDEATQIFMSRDYAYVALDGDLARVQYRDPPLSAQEQELRLLNGSINKWLIGLAWHAAGFSLNDVNEQWDWGADWTYNQSTGHAPSDALLNASRWPSAMLLASGVVWIFVAGWMLAGRPAAYCAALLYALNPLLLLNGRRAMMEGSLIAFTLLALVTALWWLRAEGGWRWAAAVAFGAASGLALASKHTAVIAIAPLFAALLIATLMRLQVPERRRAAAMQITMLALVAVIAGSVFYVLNPAWWGDPAARLGLVLHLRADLLAGQTAAFGGFASPLDALGGFFRQTFVAAPQYAEAAGWDVFLGPQISAYEASGLGGLRWGLAGGVILLAAAIAGVVTLIRRRRWPDALVVLLWAFGCLIGALLLTPLEWGRYYLLAVLAATLLAGIGLGAALTALAGRVNGRRG